MTLKSSKPIKTSLLSVLVGGAALLLSACASHGPAENPLVRKLSWFSYLEGGDFRETCGVGSPNRYRLVYNAVFTEQVRAYDVSADGRLDVGVIEPADLSHLTVRSLNDLLNPWRTKMSSRQLSAQQFSSLTDALTQDGAFGAPAVGTELSSRGFYWAVAACHEGQYHFTGLAWPSPAWESATFPNALFAVDPSPIPVNPPRKTETGRSTTVGMSGDFTNEFHLKVGEAGLAHFTPILP